MTRIHRYALLLLLPSLASLTCFGQAQKGGTPRSFSLKSAIAEPVSMLIPSPDLAALSRQDNEDASLEKPYRIGVPVPVKLNPGNSGKWENLPGGGKLWQLSLKCSGAVALGIDYSLFYLPPGSDLFIYNVSHTEITGAFNSEINPGARSFSTRPVKGDEIVLEYFQPADCLEQPGLEISGILFLYRGMDSNPRSGHDFGGSGSCEVNVNCPEGLASKSQSQGVVRILSRVRGQSFWCSGTLVNNTSLDFSPLILTANHCSQSSGQVSSADDLNKWVFYFNYESAACADPTSEPADHSVVGALKLASSENPANFGSDFYLVKLIKDIPANYLPYYNGWSNLNTASPSGVCIHHPEGDIKKISTYTTPLVSATWETTPDTHWKVQWAATASGFGVTEGGSSGSPLFDNNGLLIGSLTGGESGCTNTAGMDYFGKIAFSWTSNGSADSIQLKTWLDPLNEGRTSMQGAFNNKLTVSDFEADTTSVSIGGSLSFHDRSLGSPTSWHWYFQGAVPSESTEQNPTGIVYNSFGKYNVKLAVNNAFSTDTLIRTRYIQVKAIVFPNPTEGVVSIFLDSKNTAGLSIEVFSELGILLKTIEYGSNPGSAISLEMPGSGSFFLLRIKQGDQVQTHKVVVVRRNK